MSHTNNLYFDINRATIELIVRAYRDGNHEELKQLGIPVGIAKSLAEMRTGTYVALLNFRGAIIDFKSNVKRLGLLIEHMEQQNERDHKINELLQLGASQPMLSQIAAIDRKEYQKRCKLLGINSSSCRGKPRNLSDDECIRVMNTVQETGKASIEDPLLRWILLGRGTGIPLNLIWRFLSAEGSLTGDAWMGGKSNEAK